MYSIYALIDVRDNSIRYIGMTRNTFARLSQHLLNTGNGTPEGVWLAEMQQARVTPKLEVLEVIPSSQYEQANEQAYQRARERESYWIQKLGGSALLSDIIDSGLDRTQLRAWRTFITSHATVIDLIEHDLAEAQQLPLSSYDVLVALVEAPNRRLRMHELARAVVLSRSGLTRLVERLEREGLLRRERGASSDRRAIYAVLTLKGFRAFRSAWPIYAQGIVTHFIEHLTEQELSTLTQALGRVLAAAHNAPARASDES